MTFKILQNSNEGRGGISWWFVGKESFCHGRRHGSDPWASKIHWEGKGHPLQYSRIGNPMDRGAWWVIIHGL